MLSTSVSLPSVFQKVLAPSFRVRKKIGRVICLLGPLEDGLRSVTSLLSLPFASLLKDSALFIQSGFFVLKPSRCESLRVLQLTPERLSISLCYVTVVVVLPPRSLQRLTEISSAFPSARASALHACRIAGFLMRSSPVSTSFLSAVIAKFSPRYGAFCRDSAFPFLDNSFSG